MFAHLHRRLLTAGDAASPHSCPVSNRLLWGLRANGAPLEVTLAFNLFHLTSDMLYRRVTLCDKRAGCLCQPVSGHPWGGSWPPLQPPPTTPLAQPAGKPDSAMRSSSRRE